MAPRTYPETLRGAARGRAGRDVAVALCLLAALAVSACNTRRDQAVPVASAADLPAADAAATDTGTGATAGAGATADAATATAVLPGDTAIEDSARAPDSFETAEPADPDEVMGLGRNAVEALLGEPGLVRREAPAEVWQYQSRGCVLDVFLYEASADFEVVYLEARTGLAITAATANCLGSVMDSRRKMPSS